MFGWIILAIIFVLACIVLYASDQPGHRRRRRDSKYDGLERREDKTDVDFPEYPMFVSRRCKGCDKLKRSRDCYSKECSLKDQDPTKVNRDNT